MTTEPEMPDTLDDMAISVERRDPGHRPSPGLIRYALGRAQGELDSIGLRIVVRPKRHGPPAGPRPDRPTPDRPASVVAPEPVSGDDDPVQTATETATVASADESMELSTVLRAIELRLIAADDAPRFLGGLTLDQAIAAAEDRPEPNGDQA